MQNDKPLAQHGIFLFVITITLTIPQALASGFLKLMDWLWVALDRSVFIAIAMVTSTLDFIGLEIIFFFYSSVMNFAFSFPNRFMQVFLVLIFAYLSLTLIFFNILT